MMQSNVMRQNPQRPTAINLPPAHHPNYSTKLLNTTTFKRITRVLINRFSVIFCFQKYSRPNYVCYCCINSLRISKQTLTKSDTGMRMAIRVSAQFVSPGHLNFFWRIKNETASNLAVIFFQASTLTDLLGPHKLPLAISTRLFPGNDIFSINFRTIKAMHNL